MNGDAALRLMLSEVVNAPDEFLLMSRRNCHAERVSSIVVGPSESGGLRRYFIAWPGHRLHENRPGLSLEMEVGVHDHRYDLAISCVLGDVVNVDYEALDLFAKNAGFAGENKLRWHRLCKYEFRTAECRDTPEATKVGLWRVAETGRTVLGDQTVRLADGDLHTIEVHSEYAAWLVREGRRNVAKETTALFTNAEQIVRGGMYLPFAAGVDVIEHVANWASYAAECFLSGGAK